MIKLLCKPAGRRVSVLGGLAAALQCASFGIMVKAVLNRTAEGTRRLTGVWPDVGEPSGEEARR